MKVLGYKSGLFVSPHLASFRERMQVNNELISESSFVECFRDVLEACRVCQVPATEFEIAFLMSCLHFHRSRCDFVALEVHTTFSS